MRKLLYMMLSTLFIFGCTERIDVDIEPGFTRLAVEGSISTDFKKQTILLSTSGDYLIDQSTPKINDARVYVMKGNDSIAYENIREDGLYASNVPFSGIPNTTYTLYIKGLDIDQDGILEEYTAESTMPNPMPIDSITLGYNVKIDIWFINLWATDPPEDNWYIYKSGVNNYIRTDSLIEWQLQNDDFFRGNKTGGTFAQTVGQGSDSSAIVGDIINLELTSISEEYFDFCVNLQSESFGSNPLFGGPPANVIGNISNGALGYFSTEAITRSSVVIDSIPTVTNTPYGPPG